MKKQTTQKIENLFNQFNERIINSYPSVFNKDDVQRLLNDLSDELIAIITDTNEPETRQENGDAITHTFVLNVIHQLSHQIYDSINQMDFDNRIVDLDSAEFDIRNGNNVVLEYVSINNEDIQANITNDIEEIVDNYVSEYKMQHIGTSVNE